MKNLKVEESWTHRHYVKDDEYIPFGEDIETFLKREIAKPIIRWADSPQLGYEILPNKYFYRYQPPTPAKELLAEFWRLEKEAEKMLRGIGEFMSDDSSKGYLTPWVEKLPHEWEKSRIDSVADVFFSNVDKHTFDDERSIRLCNYADVYKNDRITGAIDFMEASADQREVERFQIRQGDLLVTKDSETPDDIAISALVDRRITWGSLWLSSCNDSSSLKTCMRSFSLLASCI